VNLRDWALWGFVGTVVLTALMSASQGLGFSRMSLPYILGTLFTSNRDRAMLYGTAVHLLNGWIIAFIYAAAFQAWGSAGPVRGGLAGLIHATFVLVVVFPTLPAFHPRMASETSGPTARRQLEPPGLLGLHYGYQTPLSVVISHVVYGLVLGAFYHLPG
jgi:uncharacterized membrane protein YagU involved in acid resistance